jgi:hypothetical protein
MVNSSIKIGFTGILLLYVMFTQAQGVRVKATANKDHIVVGEPVLLQLEAECGAGENLSWFEVDSLPHFELADRGKIDTLSGSMGTMYKQSLVITSFDSGSQVIPRLAITLNNNRFLTDSIKIEVGYSGADPNQPYHDIKDIIELPAVEPLYVNYIIAVVTLIAIVALILLLRYKNKTTQAAPAKPKSGLKPYEQAMVSLAALKETIADDHAPDKLFYVQLNDVLREYCREVSVGALPASSNAQLVVDLQPWLANAQLISLAQELRLIDAVKFARYQPSQTEGIQVFDTVKESIEKIHQQLIKKTSA